jgi:hypothetical protein
MMILFEYPTEWTSHVFEYKSRSVLRDAREEVGQLELHLNSAGSLRDVCSHVPMRKYL